MKNYLDFTIGIVGGGQLGRMLAYSAFEMGFKISILDPDPEAPAMQICHFPIVASYNDKEAFQKLIEYSNVITYEFENVDEKNLEEASKIINVYPSTEILKISKNRIKEKKVAEAFGIPIPQIFFQDYLQNDDKRILDLLQKLKETQKNWILKTAENGYDGKFQIRINPQKEIEILHKEIQKIFHVFNRDSLEFIVEEKINFDFEFSIIASCFYNQNQEIEVAFYPPFINYHNSGILRKTILDLDFVNPEIEKIKENIKKFIKSYKYIGTLTMEFFYKDSKIYFNEMAPRVHNSGHLTIEAFNYSQFQQHILSITHLPVQNPKAYKYAAMLNLVSPTFLERNPYLIQEIKKIPESYFHYYGKKEAKPNRKMGHITLLNDDKEELIINLNYLEKLLYGEITDY